jgi:hypothetical protein
MKKHCTALRLLLVTLLLAPVLLHARAEGHFDRGGPDVEVSSGSGDVSIR